MIKLKYVLFTGLVSLISVGCTDTQPSFDPEHKEIREVDGKQYRVPHAATTSSYAVESKVIKFYQSIGVSNCKEGDITWEDNSVAEAVNSQMRSGSKAEGVEIYRKAAAEGKVGCASPL